MVCYEPFSYDLRWCHVHVSLCLKVGVGNSKRAADHYLYFTKAIL